MSDDVGRIAAGWPTAEKFRRRLLWLAIVALPGFALAAFLHVGSWLAAPATSPVAADAVVILGGDYNNRRARKGGELFSDGYVRQVVLTGGAGISGARNASTGDPRVKFLLGMGVPASALIFDSTSRNSWEEARTIRRMMDERGWKRVIVVSDPPHLRRLNLALGYVLANAALDFVLVPGELEGWRPEAWWENEELARYIVREILGLGWYTLRIVLWTPLDMPRFLAIIPWE